MSAAIRSNPNPLLGSHGETEWFIGFAGILPIIQWLLSHTKYPPATLRLLKLERLQIFTMLAYFPTEQLYYLRVHDIIPATATFPILGKTVGLNAKKLLQASSKFYLAYIVLEFFRLKERSGLLRAKEKALRESNANSAEANAEKIELKHSLDAHKLATAYNTFRFPGALHWYVDLPDSRFVSPLLFASRGSCVAPNPRP